MNEQTKIPKSVSQYMASLAHRANAKLRGSVAAKDRAQKALAGRRRKAAERKAAPSTAQ